MIFDLERVVANFPFLPCWFRSVAYHQILDSSLSPEETEQLGADQVADEEKSDQGQSQGHDHQELVEGDEAEGQGHMGEHPAEQVGGVEGREGEQQGVPVPAQPGNNSQLKIKFQFYIFKNNKISRPTCNRRVQLAKDSRWRPHKIAD